MKRRIAILLTAVMLMISLAGCKEKTTAPELLKPIETANAVCVVKKAPLTVVKSTGGYVVPECVDMSFDYETSAYRVAVDLGEHVTQGQLLMELNPGLEDEIKRLEIDIVREQTEYDYDLEQFNKQLRNMRNYANSLGNSYSGRMMRLQIQEMQLSFERSHTELEKKLADARENLQKKQQEAADAKVYAPCDGTVVYQSVYEDGDVIYEDKTFLSIAKDDSRLLACGFISASDYALYTSAQAKIGDDIYDVKYIPYTEDEVYRLDRTGNRYDSYFTAELKDDVATGDYVQFLFTMTTEEPVLSVPTSALTKNGTQYSVMLVREGYMESREVTIGEAGLNDTEILTGLAEGDTVFVAKNLTRYGVEYETATPSKETFVEHIGCTGARKVARISEPYENKVPGAITEIHLNGISNITVKKGDPIFTVKASVSRSDQEQAKVDLRQYTDSYEEARGVLEDKLEELEKRMKRISKSSLEYALAELDRNDCLAEIEELDKTAGEEIEKLTERIENFEAWNEQTVTIVAEKDCVVSSISKYKVGTELREGEILFDMYDLKSFSICLDKPAEDNRLRYGQKITLSSAVDGGEVEFPAHIISAANVRPEDVTDKNIIYIALDDEDKYSEIGTTGIVYYDEYNIADTLVVDEALVYHDPKPASSNETTEPRQTDGGNWGQSEQDSSYEEVESFTLDSEEHALSKGRAYVWVYDESNCAVKRYVRIMRVDHGKCWIIDGVSDNETIIVH